MGNVFGLPYRVLLCAQGLMKAVIAPIGVCVVSKEARGECECVIPMTTFDVGSRESKRALQPRRRHQTH